MPPRFSIFNAGYRANIPSLHFKRKDLIEEHEKNILNEERAFILAFSKTLEDELSANLLEIQTAINLANQLDVSVPPEPSNSTDYFKWTDIYTKKFEERFPMNKIDHYYFNYSKKLADILCNLGLSQTLLQLMRIKPSSDLSKKIERCYQETEYLLFKMTAAAALLSSEYGHAYFNTLFKDLKERFNVFKSLIPRAYNDSSVKKLTLEISFYNETIRDGFGKCSGILEKLGI